MLSGTHDNLSRTWSALPVAESVEVVVRVLRVSIAAPHGD